MEKKIWCEFFKSTIYDSRCLIKRSQTISGNKRCEQCMLFENLELRNKLEEAKLLWKKKIHREPSLALSSRRKSRDPRKRLSEVATGSSSQDIQGSSRGFPFGPEPMER